MEIRIDFQPGKDRTAYLQHLMDEGVFSQDSHGRFRQKGYPSIAVSMLNPIEFALSILEPTPEKLIGKTLSIEGEEIDVDIDLANSIIQPLYAFYHDDGAELEVVSAGKLIKTLKLAELFWDDYESILMDGRPVEDLSPGQRSSAMLPLIVLVENTPLIIDQPEDNLDNRLIGGLLVSILANLKEKRQILVATHNPNIVVLGDAEQVVVLDAIDDSNGVIECMGSIDNPQIIQSVIDIMEGGEEAFKLRNRRYNI